MDNRFSDEFKNMIALQNQINAGAKQLEKSLEKQIEMQKDILRVKENIANTDAIRKKLEAERNASIKEEERINAEIGKLSAGNKKRTEAQVQALKKELEAVQAIKKEKGEKLVIAEKELESQKAGLLILQKSVKESNLLKSIANSTAGLFKKGFSYIRTSGVFELDKEIRNAARSMGVGNKEFSKFSDNLVRAGQTTNMIGVSTKELAKLQQGYSEEIGRSVRLSEKGLVAMAEMAEGTGLGNEFAVSMAGAMDNLGGSVQTSNKLIEDTMNKADSMGVNSAKAAKSLQQNLKLAQKYNFKGGVKGLAQMTTEALKLKLDIEGIAGLVDKVFRPEGAVEMAAKLQTMGGAFAQMADPMRLMFKARNDFEGFAKDIGKATAEFVKYNSETGTFDLQGGLAADRMREISTMTNIGVEELQKMATAQKRIQMIGSVVPIGVDDETIGIIESISEIGKNGEIRITKGDFNGKLLKDLTRQQLSTLKEEQKTLEERAKKSRTAVEQLQDILNTFKDLLIPIAQGLTDGLGTPLKEMLKNWKKEGFYDKLQAFTKGIGEGIISLGKTLVKFVDFLGPKGTLAAIFTGILAKETWWLARGAMLGMGFNMTASVGGGTGGAGGPGFFGMGGKSSGMGGQGFGKDYKTWRSMGGSRFGALKEATKLNKWGMGARMGAGLGLGALAMGGSALRSNMDDPNSSSGKMLGVGNAALTGASLGMMLGPWGALAGGLIGGGVGAYNEYFSKAARDRSLDLQGTKSDVADGIIKFHPRDKFMVANDAVVASTSQNQLNTLSDKISNGIAEVKHKFDDIKVTININATGIDNEIGKHLIDDKKFIRLLKTRINEEASMVLSGGILSGKPK